MSMYVLTLFIAATADMNPDNAYKRTKVIQAKTYKLAKIQAEQACNNTGAYSFELDKL